MSKPSSPLILTLISQCPYLHLDPSATVSPVSLNRQPPPVPAPHVCGDESASPSVSVRESWECGWSDMGRDRGAASGSEFGLTLIPYPYLQEAVQRERLVSWWESWGPLIPHLQVSILFSEGIRDGRVRGQGSHTTSGSVSLPVCPQGLPHLVLE